jgi:HNH endonuclease
MEHGDPLFTKYASTETKLKFINDVVLSCENLECLIWPFSRRDGRGYINEEPVSRFVCKLAHGSPPTEKHDAAHNCGNERCVNPHHLRWATGKTTWPIAIVTVQISVAKRHITPFSPRPTLR